MSPSPYVALVGREYVEGANSLAELLALLAEIVEPAVNEDVAVWHGARLVVVFHPGGSQTWLRPALRPTEPEAA
ncbi:MAG TPA: hypothetical protein VFW33_23775 [Gemmataceae bacterium]|nr:hypothetical protein [Gemmataceae bacterium]